MSSGDTLSLIVGEIGAALAPLETAVSSSAGFSGLLRDLGWAWVGEVPAPIAALGSTVADLAALVESFADGSPSAAELEALQSKIRAVVVAVRALEHAAPGTFPAELEAADFASEFGGRLIDFLVVTHLQRNHTRVETILRALGVVRVALVPAAGARPAYVSRTLALPDIGDLLRDPSVVLTRLYGWGTLDFHFQDFMENIADLLSDFGIDVYLHELDQRLTSALQPAAPPSSAVRWSLKAPLFVGEADGAGVEIGVGLFGLPAQGSHLPGLSLLPYAEGEVQESVQLTEFLKLTVDADADLTAGVGVVVRPNESLDILTKLVPSAGSGVAPPSGATLRVGLDASAQDGGPTTLVGVEGVGALVVNAVSIVGAAHVSSAGTPDIGVELTFKGATFQNSSAGADTFVQSVVPSGGGTPVGFDLTLGLSAARGFYFGGGAALQATIPVQLSFAGITFQAIVVGVAPDDGALALEIGATFEARIGPLSASIQNVGLSLALSFPDGGGDLGPLGVTAGFKPPSGVGLAIDAAGVSGGGFLGYSSANHEYSGVLQLKFDNLQLQAFGLITTQVAGGQGYSLLALVDANFPPVQLGWGFTLDGVGGLLAVHRTASVDALRVAIKAGKLTFLFPRNAIANASQILGQVDTYFPTAPGRFLFGPMAQIGWGTPTLLTASVAVILELPEPIDIILLANLTALLPNPSAPLVRLNMDALGVLDLTQDEVSLDASLYDSKLVSFPISGDMALRACWSSQREFLLAIGGFHPQFSPPAGFPTLNRVTISMPSGIVSKLRLAAYLALTSNTVQFGATLDVFIGVSGCGLTGHLGFDALLQLDPFHFDADISGSVAITVSGDDFASVSLDATLSGPAPWHIAGKFKIHIIFFDVHVSFHESWGLNAPSQQTVTVDVGALLGMALSDPRNWNSQLPAGASAMVALSQIDESNLIVAHPLALLEVHEQVVPLDLEITRFGQAVPSGAAKFSITDFRVGNQTAAYAAVQDDFAPAQFFDLTDDEKLARPSYEQHDAGAIMSGNLVTNGTPVAKSIDYESFFINTPGVVTVDEGVQQPFPWKDLPVVMLSGSAARKSISQAGKLRFAAAGNPIHVAEPAFAVADTTTLAAATATPAAGTTYSDAASALRAATASQRQSLQIVGMHELMKAAA